MKSTLARWKAAVKFRGKVRIRWAEQNLDEYLNALEIEHPKLAKKIEKTPFVKFQ